MPTDRLIVRLAEAQNWRCAYCGVSLDYQKSYVPIPSAATRDHVVSKRDGGGNDAGNLVACCYGCNTQRGDIEAQHFFVFRSAMLRRGLWLPGTIPDRSIREVLVKMTPRKTPFPNGLLERWYFSPCSLARMIKRFPYMAGFDAVIAYGEGKTSPLISVMVSLADEAKPPSVSLEECENATPKSDGSWHLESPSGDLIFVVVPGRFKGQLACRAVLINFERYPDGTTRSPKPKDPRKMSPKYKFIKRLREKECDEWASA